MRDQTTPSFSQDFASHVYSYKRLTFVLHIPDQHRKRGLWFAITPVKPLLIEARALTNEMVTVSYPAVHQEVNHLLQVEATSRWSLMEVPMIGWTFTWLCGRYTDRGGTHCREHMRQCSTRNSAHFGFTQTAHGGTRLRVLQDTVMYWALPISSPHTREYLITSKVPTLHDTEYLTISPT